jgi:excisionase family DNA binding protein
MHHSTPLAYSPEHAAALLGLSSTTVRRRIKDGSIASARLGRRVLVTRAELERLLRPSTHTPAPASLRSGGRPLA